MCFALSFVLNNNGETKTNNDYVIGALLFHHLLPGSDKIQILWIIVVLPSSEYHNRQLQATTADGRQLCERSLCGSKNYGNKSEKATLRFWLL